MKPKVSMRPEEDARGPAAHYDRAEAQRYSAEPQTVAVQTRLAERALELLQAAAGEALAAEPRRPGAKRRRDEPGPSGPILDLGAGSGLSGQVVEAAGLQWVGVDVSPAMLEVARAKRRGRGGLLLADMGRLPLRRGTFRHVMGISSLQWLKRPELPAFFAALGEIVEDGGCAVFQVYCDSQGHADAILGAARANGFRGGLFVDVPHRTPARKTWVVLWKTEQLARAFPPCALCFPQRGSCCLHLLRQAGGLGTPKRGKAAADGGRSAAPREGPSLEKLHAAHVKLVKRASRLIRRAVQHDEAATFTTMWNGLGKGSARTATRIWDRWPSGARDERPALSCKKLVASLFVGDGVGEPGPELGGLQAALEAAVREAVSREGEGEEAAGGRLEWQPFASRGRQQTPSSLAATEIECVEKHVGGFLVDFGSASASASETPAREGRWHVNAWRVKARNLPPNVALLLVPQDTPSTVGRLGCAVEALARPGRAQDFELFALDAWALADANEGLKLGVLASFWDASDSAWHEWVGGTAEGGRPPSPWVRVEDWREHGGGGEQFWRQNSLQKVRAMCGVSAVAFAP